MVGGDDGFGNSGSFATIILVAPFNLQGRATLPNPTISISGGSEPSVTAKITYPNGTAMKTGSVEAFVSLDMDGVLTPIGHARMTYQLCPNHSSDRIFLPLRAFKKQLPASIS